MIKKTPLHNWHMHNGAHMADFGGYHMPLWYQAGIKEEHLSVLQHAGIFDTSHMAVVLVEGQDSRDLLQKCFSRNLERCIERNKKPLSAGRCIYGVFLYKNGHVIDDAILYKVNNQLYMIVVNSGMGESITTHLDSYKKGRNVTVTDLSDKIGKMDIQGPSSAMILSELTDKSEMVFADLPYFSFKGFFEEIGNLNRNVTLKDGTPFLLSRTGYTGEFGFEIFIKPEHIEKLWIDIFHTGKEYHLLPCGLGARDSLRTGALLPLSHQDIGYWPFLNKPWSFALPYDDQQKVFTKTFVGSKRLMEIEYTEHTYPFVGFNVRKVPVGENTEVIDDKGKVIGSVLTCVTDMAIGRLNGHIYSINSPNKPADFSPTGLSCGFVKVSKQLKPGTELDLKAGTRQIKVEITEDIRPHRTARKPMKEMFSIL